MRNVNTRSAALAFALAAAALLTFGATAGEACGDKALRIGRGARFQRTARPASILIYVSPNAPADALSKAPRLQSFLKKVGHKSRVVQGGERLGEALGSGQYDLVLSSLGEAAGLQRRLAEAPSRPALVPLIYKATKEEAAAALKAYRHVVRDASSGDDYVEAIEAAMKARARA
jgi:hypothetical protein